MTLITNGNLANNTLQNVASLAQTAQSTTSTKKNWDQMNLGEKVLHFFTLGIYSPKLSSDQIREAQSMVQLFIPIESTPGMWMCRFDDGSGIAMAKRDDNSLLATMWDLSQKKPFSGPPVVFDGDKAHLILNALDNKTNGTLTASQSSFVSEKGRCVFLPSSFKTVPCLLSLAIATEKGKPKGFNSIDQNQKTAMNLKEQALKQVVSEYAGTAEKAITLKTTVFKEQNNNKAPIQNIWNDIRRNLVISEQTEVAASDQVAIEGISLTPEARRILREAIVDNKDHIPTLEQRDKIIKLQPGVVTEEFCAALTSSIAMTTLATVTAQAMITNARILMPGMNELQEQVLSHCGGLTNPSSGRRIEVTTQGATPGTYKGMVTYVEPVVKIDIDAKDHSTNFGVAVTRAEIVGNSQIELPIETPNEYEMEWPITYSGDIYWAKH